MTKYRKGDLVRVVSLDDDDLKGGFSGIKVGDIRLVVCTGTYDGVYVQVGEAGSECLFDFEIELYYRPKQEDLR